MPSAAEALIDDRAPVRELDGIADKVEQHLREATLIAAANGQIRGDFNIERQILFGRERLRPRRPRRVRCLLSE